MKLNEDQQKALRKIASFLVHPTHKHCVVDAPGGCGKGYLLRYLDTHWNEVQNYCGMYAGDTEIDKTVFTATTNEAVHSLGIHTANTIYRTACLYVNKGRLTSYGKPYQAESICVDEASYIDEDGFNTIVAQYPNTKFIWVMDQFQLAPVKSNKPYVPSIADVTITLDTIERAQGAIASLVRDLREGVRLSHGVDIQRHHNGTDIIVCNSTEFQHRIVDSYKKDAANCLVTAYTNKRVMEYNHAINERVLGNPEFPYIGAEGVVISFKRDHPPVGTRFIVEELPPDNDFMYTTAGGFRYSLSASDSSGLLVGLPYASTVHKAQGKTVETVFVDAQDIFQTRDAELRRRLFYVAVSRASKQVVICL